MLSKEKNLSKDSNRSKFTFNKNGTKQYSMQTRKQLLFLAQGALVRFNRIITCMDSYCIERSVMVNLDMWAFAHMLTLNALHYTKKKVGKKFQLPPDFRATFKKLHKKLDTPLERSTLKLNPQLTKGMKELKISRKNKISK